MLLAALSLLATLSSADAVAVVLNSRNAVGVRTFSEAKEIVELWFKTEYAGGRHQRRLDEIAAIEDKNFK